MSKQKSPKPTPLGAAGPAAGTLPKPKLTEEEARELEREKQELFRTWGKFARSGVDVSMLRQALMNNPVLTGNPGLRTEFDRIRLELDAYLSSITEGEAAVQEPDGFAPSPELSEEQVRQLAATLLSAAGRHEGGPKH